MVGARRLRCRGSVDARALSCRLCGRSPRRCSTRRRKGIPSRSGPFRTTATRAHTPAKGRTTGWESPGSSRSRSRPLPSLPRANASTPREASASVGACDGARSEQASASVSVSIGSRASAPPDGADAASRGRELAARAWRRDGRCERTVRVGGASGRCATDGARGRRELAAREAADKQAAETAGEMMARGSERASERAGMVLIDAPTSLVRRGAPLAFSRKPRARQPRARRGERGGGMGHPLT